jgi:bacteriorhodopsin
MKVTVLFALLVTVAAQDSAQEQSSPEQSSADQSSGYGDQEKPDSYRAQEQSYGAATEEYHAPTETASYGAVEEYQAPAPKCCVSFCPPHSPFFSKASCACHAGLQTYEAPQHAVQSYGESSELSNGYRNLGLQAPDNTIDTRNNVLNRAATIVLWVVFATLFLLGAYFIRMYEHYEAIGSSDDASDFGSLDSKTAMKELGPSILFFLSRPCLQAGIVCLIASLANLTMATGSGWYARCEDGRMFFFARYIDWVITTPLLICILARFGNYREDWRHFCISFDVIMIVSGLIASTISGGAKWLFFAISLLAFLPIIHFIQDHHKNLRLDNRTRHPKFGHVVANTTADAVYLPYIWWVANNERIANLTAVVWSLYPIVWILAEGTGKLSVSGEAILYAILDVIAKGLFGWFVVNSSFYDAKEITASGVTLTDKTNRYFQ